MIGSNPSVSRGPAASAHHTGVRTSLDSPKGPFGREEPAINAANLTIEQLVDILDFKREVMSQLIVVSTLLAVLAMSVVAILFASPERTRLRSALLVVLTTSTLLLVFGTMLDAIIMPAMKRNATHSNAGQIRALLNLSELVVWSMLLGTAFLFASLGAYGFAYSRRVGICTLIAATLMTLVFVVSCVYLDRAMTR